MPPLHGPGLILRSVLTKLSELHSIGLAIRGCQPPDLWEDSLSKEEGKEEGPAGQPDSPTGRREADEPLPEGEITTAVAPGDRTGADRIRRK